MKVTIKDKSGAARVVELAPQARPYAIGRAADCDVTLESPQVSAVHARLQLDARGLAILDAGSINGVYIAGKRIGARPCPLSAGQEFTIADFTLSAAEFEGAARPPRRRLPLLLAALPLLLIAAGMAWLAARRPAAPPPPPPAAPASNLPSAALPVLSTQEQARLDQAGTLINQGERALYERNDYVGAARLFNAALADNPNDLRAGNYLALVRTRALPDLLQRGEECLRAGDHAGARTALNDLEAVAPDNDDVKYFRRILDGLKQYQRARELAGKGEWEAAVKILEGIIIPDDSNRVEFMEAARRQVGWRNDLRQAEECIRRREYPAALAGLQRIMAQADADPRLLRETQDRSRLVEQVMLVKSAAADSNRYAAAISAGNTLLASPSLRPFPAAQADLRGVLDDLRGQLLPQRAVFAARLADCQARLAEAEKAGQDFAAAQAGRESLDNAIVLDFLDGKAAPSPEREQLRRQIRNYARESFQRGYVLKEQGRHEQALECFDRAAALTEPYDELAVRARAQRAAVQKLLAARPGAAAAARGSLNTAPAPGGAGAAAPAPAPQP